MLFRSALIAPSNDIPEGLEQFDVIISADGQAVNRQTELTDHVRNKKVGDTIELVIIRDRIFKNVTVTLKKLEVEARTLYDKKGNITPPGTKPKEKPNDFLLIEIHLNNLTKNRRNRV